MSASLSAMVDLRGEPGGDLFLSWTEAPGARSKPISRADQARLRALAQAVSDAESANRGIVPAREALSTALFDLLEGPERALGQRIARAEAEGRRLDLVVRARTGDRRVLREHAATWMRWELLPYAETRRHGRPPFTVVLQLGPKDPAEPRVLPHGGLRVLFMASSPADMPPELDFEHEEEQMLAALAPFAERRRARLRVVEEGTLDDLGRALLVERFDVVHLTGHGFVTPEGPRLAMEDAFGSKRLVSPAQLVEVLEAAKAMPELVMVSSCHSAEVRGSIASFAAELVAAGVPNVLGWTQPVRDDVATEAAKGLYQQLATGKTPVEAAHLVRERMRRDDERAPVPGHAWGTLHLVSSAAAGFRVGDGEEPLSERFDRGEVYRYLGRHMRVLETGFVGRRRLLQRLLRVVVHGKDVRPEGTRDVAGACVFGMKGVGKSCAVGRTIERAKQDAPDLGVVVLHGEVDERSVLEAFQEAAGAGGGDEAAERMLARADEKVFRRVRRVMELWRGRPMAIVLDDFEQNLERRSDGPWLLAPGAAALLEAVLPVCAEGRPKLLVTSTAEFRMPAGHERALAFVELGSFEPAAVRKLWMRGQASNELGSVTLGSWEDLAERLGRNARVLAWARSLCAHKTDAELAKVAARAKAELPVWKVGDEADEEKRAELAALFLRHMACDEARAAFGEGALAFVKRARVFEAAVPRDAFAALVEGLGVDLARDLDALASWGLMEVGELDGARAYRVSPLVEPRFEAEDAARWHEVAAEVWEGLAERATNKVAALERAHTAWEHALKTRKVERADRLARWIDGVLFRAGLYGENLRLAERHLEALPESPFGHVWAGYAEFKAGRPGPRATERVQRGLALVIGSVGTEEHADVAASFHALGGVLEAQGDLAGARGALERSLDIEVKLLGTEDHLNVAASLHELGRVLHGQGDLADARRTLERSLDVKARVLGKEEHPDVALSLQGLGVVLELQGDLAGARGALERSLDIMAKTLGTEDHPFVAAALHSLGGVLQGLGDLTGARKALERSLDIKVKVLGTAEHLDVATVLHTLGGLLEAQGDLAGARSALERSLDIKVKVLGREEHADVAVSLQALGGVLRVQGDLAGARSALERSLDLWAKVLDTEEHREVAAALHSLGGVLHGQGDLSGARRALERSLDILVKVVATEEHPDVATTYATIGTVLATEGRSEEALASYRRALAIRGKCFKAPDHYMSAETEVSLAMLLLQLGREDEASELLEHALRVLAEQVPNHPILHQFRAVETGARATPAAQPDEPCPCDSGQPFRACHGMPGDQQPG